MANKKCDCHSAVDPSELSTLGIMAHSASKVIAGPVSKGTAHALLQYCSTHNCGQSEALRKALTLLSASKEDPEAVLDSLRELLGLDTTASQEEVTTAVAALFGAAGESADPSADALDEGADPKPQSKPEGTAPASLSADQKAIAAHIADPRKRARFLEMCARSPLQLAGGKPFTKLSAGTLAAAARIKDPKKRAQFLELRAKSPL